MDDYSEVTLFSNGAYSQASVQMTTVQVWHQSLQSYTFLQAYVHSLHIVHNLFELLGSCTPLPAFKE